MSEEEQRAAAATSDLQAVAPDSWQNIPAPLKQAVSLIIKHLLSLSHAHTAMQSSMSFSSETLNTRLKQAIRSMTTQVESVTGVGKRNSEEIETGRIRWEREIQTVKDAFQTKIEAENTALTKDIANLRESHEELAAKVIGLQNVISTTLTDVKTTIANIKSSTRYEIEEFLLKPELESIRDEAKDLTFAYKKTEKQLISRIDVLEDYQKTVIQAKLEKVDKAVEATLSNLTETKELSMNYIGIIEKSVETSLKPIISETNRLKVTVEKQIAEMPVALGELKQYLEEFAVTVGSKHEGIFEKVAEMVETEGKTLRNEAVKASKAIVGLIEEKERELLSGQYAAISSLESRMMRQQETYVESQIKDMRQKLQVRFPSVASHQPNRPERDDSD